LARRREFDEEKVLDAIRDVFWEFGYDGTSYAQIMSATGLQKGSLYAAFGDKKSLYLNAIRRYDAGAVSGAIAMLTSKTMPGRERIGLLMDALIGDAETRQGRWGCLLCNAAVDMAPFDGDTEQIVTNSMNRFKTAISTALKDTDNPKGSELIWASYFGGRVLIKAGMSKSALKNLKKQVMAQI